MNSLGTERHSTRERAPRLVDSPDIAQHIWDIQQAQLVGQVSTRQSTNRQGQRVVSFTFTATTGTQVSKLDRCVEWVENTQCLDRNRFFKECEWSCGSVDLWTKAIKRLRASGRVAKERGINIWSE